MSRRVGGGAAAAGLAALALAVCGACGDGRAAPGQDGAPNSRTAAVPVSESCADAAHLAGGHEYQGLASPPGRALWALAENDSADGATHTTKIRWRANGHGTPRIVATLPTGQTVVPDQAPVLHLGSDWTEPGTDEWGTSWRLPSGGCWTFQFTRDDLSGKLALRVG